MNSFCVKLWIMPDNHGWHFCYNDIKLNFSNHQMAFSLGKLQSGTMSIASSVFRETML